MVCSVFFNEVGVALGSCALGMVFVYRVVVFAVVSSEVGIEPRRSEFNMSLI